MATETLLRASAGKVLTVAVGVIGPGLVGSTLIKQVTAQADKLRDLLKASIRVVGIANSKQMYVNADGLPEDNWKEVFHQKGEDLNLHRFAELLKGCERECCVLVDCTASDVVPNMYLHYIKMGMHIVSPNKKFGAGPLDRYLSLKPLSQEAGRHFLYEATVGAGLPVLSTLRSLIETGDRIIKIEGILSGTLSYLFNTYKPGMKFSDVVADAKAKGYTEPDPREDLSGTDVARKVVILARECGLPVELKQLHVESLVPEPLAQLATKEEYMEQLHKYDGDMEARAAAAESLGEVIRYIGKVDMESKACSVNLTSYPRSHPFAQLSGSDNLIVFTTERYRDRPLIVRGPGAGAEVTAAGVFADLIQVNAAMGGHPAAAARDLVAGSHAVWLVLRATMEGIKQQQPQQLGGWWQARCYGGPHSSSSSS
eukprot:CAMPEP_0202897424 /NCGR_PEP_ID=MMETSP1392-20130828/6184_1 /ASSEMBLY_ACC=CAM_ASM_000868 /TAXON_ID=225041 /ORGANISM="Chlamydomonas chlamydogama, Strain SAG 11-48b" /LENGTH=426 /DNA_ID=CAMNT_0049583049 /DNA_START=61 /DNA_END=1342 /DNA_ORIENTATION=-